MTWRWSTGVAGCFVVLLLGFGCARQTPSGNINMSVRNVTVNDHVPVYTLQTNTTAAATVVNITPNGFEPEIVTVPVGATVEWKNLDVVTRQPIADTSASHPSSDQLQAFGGLAPGAAFDFTFTTPGTLHYHDATVPSHIGTIVVELSLGVNQ